MTDYFFETPSPYVAEVGLQVFNLLPSVLSAGITGQVCTTKLVKKLPISLLSVSCLRNLGPPQLCGLFSWNFVGGLHNMAMGIWAEFVYGTEAGYHTLPVDMRLCAGETLSC